jgi:hypothetical protein
VRNRKALPPLTEGRIITWARAHRRQFGRWPTEDAGPIPGTRGEVWSNLAAALSQGVRGLPAGDTLARLLSRHREKSDKNGVFPRRQNTVTLFGEQQSSHALGSRYRAEGVTDRLRCFVLGLLRERSYAIETLPPLPRRHTSAVRVGLAVPAEGETRQPPQLLAPKKPWPTTTATLAGKPEVRSFNDTRSHPDSWIA